VRIEDTILVMKAGPKILSAALPRGADEIERLMAKPR
jgi:Xaa-Pro aminopeptidase